MDKDYFLNLEKIKKSHSFITPEVAANIRNHTERISTQIRRLDQILGAIEI